jgi:hypothetical protein
MCYMFLNLSGKDEEYIKNLRTQKDYFESKVRETESQMNEIMSAIPKQ